MAISDNDAAHLPPASPESAQVKPESEWVPIVGRVMGMVCFYNPFSHRVRVKKRYHGAWIEENVSLPPIVAPGSIEIMPESEWVPIAGRYMGMVCYYNPFRHRVRVKKRRHGAWIEENVSLPQPIVPDSSAG